MKNEQTTTATHPKFGLKYYLGCAGGYALSIALAYVSLNGMMKTFYDTKRHGNPIISQSWESGNKVHVENNLWPHIQLNSDVKKTTVYTLIPTGTEKDWNELPEKTEGTFVRIFGNKTQYAFYPNERTPNLEGLYTKLHDQDELKYVMVFYLAIGIFAICAFISATIHIRIALKPTQPA
jgi:hypothetical protein